MKKTIKVELKEKIMKEVLFLNPVFQERIWGGNRLHEEFGYEIPSDKTGECWAISGHKNGEATIKNGEWKGESLAHLYANHPEFFGEKEKGQNFPLLVKVLDAKADLSVQVHPGDEYAQEFEGELGKTECWYVLDCQPNAKIVYGHNAKTKEELKTWIEEGKWSELLHEVPVQKGDFFYVPSGMVHAIGEGIMILEIQQSSDTTYRVYDYDRKDDAGNLRELHLKQALDVITVPCEYPVCKKVEEHTKGGVITTLAEEHYFSVYRWDIDGIFHWQQKAPYTLVSIIDGAGRLIVDGTSYELQKGDHFLLPYDVTDTQWEGKFTAVLANNSQKRA